MLSKKMVNVFLKELQDYKRDQIEQERAATELCFGLNNDREQPVKKGETHDKSTGSGREVFKNG